MRLRLLSKSGASFALAGFAIITLIIVAAGLSLLYRPFPANVSQITTTTETSNQLSQLPTMNQAPGTREIWIQWQKTQSGLDRFEPSFIIVNQGDTVKLTFINNDTVIHNFVVGAPYDIDVNASVPGLYNDLTLQKVTTPATNNSPGVTVTGTPGSVIARYTFVAKYPGIYEFVCTYHITIGMFGYLVVLPNAGYQAPNTSNSTASQTITASPQTSQVQIVMGAAYPNSTGYAPGTITVMIGVNNTVTWTNDDTAPHTVTATDHSFDSGNLNPGDTWSYTFTKPGTYNYICTYHPWMRGTIIVVA